MEQFHHKLVVTGAPASGKTEFINRLKNVGEFENFHFFDELARTLLQSDPTYRHRWEQFHLDIYNRQLERENEAELSFISDRGTLDAAAFYPELFEVIPISISREYRRYTAVIQLGSSAALGEYYFRPDSIRTESIQQVSDLETATQKLWSGHMGYRFIEAEVDYEAKYLKFEEIMKKIVSGT